MQRFLMAAVAVVLSTGAAFAHAHYRSSTPADGGTVAVAPAELSVTYSEGVEPRFSSIEVRDAAGTRVDKGDAHVAAGDDKVFSVGLRVLPPGRYTVTWHVTAVDTHKTEGTFGFSVGP